MSNPPTAAGATAPIDQQRGGAAASSPSGHRIAFLTLGALGVVFGDLGTSPLYALQACFSGSFAVPAGRDNVLGVLSLFVWSLIIVVSVKYIALIMRADNQGEGGILALLTLALGQTAEADPAPRGRFHGVHWLILMLGFAGAALLYGDGIITPAISVLSALEGLEVATPVFHPVIVPLAIAILIGLFAIQPLGTGRVGAVFGVVLAIWFASIAALGTWSLATHGAAVLAAFDPRWGIRFFVRNGWYGIAVLGAVVLCLTGVEALYADMGHFGRVPIRLAWYTLALPALVLNYLGQGALILARPGAATQPFFGAVPPWALYPMVGLATAATVVASQALIAAVFSMTRQASQLGLLPRVSVVHTSSLEIGQIYLPGLNWVLMLACVALVLAFRSSNALAAAFGLAVAGTMTITTVLFAVVARRRWQWSRATVGAVAGVLLIIDVAFLSANVLKIASGGWFPLVCATLVFTLMTTWTRGRALVRADYSARAMKASEFIAAISSSPPPRVRGSAVFMHGVPDDVPAALLHNLKHNRVLHDTVVMLTVLTERVPYVEPANQIAVTSLGQGFWSVVCHYGFREQPNVPALLRLAEPFGLSLVPAQTSYYLSRESIVPSATPGMARWRERLYGLMQRNATPAFASFNLPPNRIVELGTQVEI